jgi:hypothetical protein
MAYQTPMTIEDALENIHKRTYVLPAIQREFVWSQEKIARLFDSLLQGYPIGAFLFWQIPPEDVNAYKYYDFMLHYHQVKRKHCEQVSIPPGADVSAVLDGQQRLTSFNIGLRGSHAVKEPRKWYNNPDAYIEKRLYLNLLAPAPENDLGMVHDFHFLSDSEAEERDESHFWFRVGDVLDWKKETDAFPYLSTQGLLDGTLPKDDAFERLTNLYRAVKVDGTIPYYNEKRPDLDKVLDIFIRVNSGGTPLSHSDLLLSIATAQWDKLDARKEIYELVDELNATRNGFDFSKDFVLKAGLMLCDISSVRFQVTNFSHDNMLILEKNWEQVASALRLAAKLAANYGYSRDTLSAHSAVLPIAYYLHSRGLEDGYLLSAKAREDRERIQRWLIRSLLKTGIWGSGLDTLLTVQRSAIQKHGDEHFPVAQLEAVMARRGKSLRFNEEEIEDLADVEYKERRAFSILALLYPFIDLRHEFHVDHVFPRAQLTPSKLKKLGVAPDDLYAFTDNVNRIGNLQLLEGPNNIEKRDMLPAEWLEMKYPDAVAREAYIDRHDLGVVPTAPTGFPEFYKARRSRLVQKLSELLIDGTQGPASGAKGAL